MVLAKNDTVPSFILGTVHHLGPKPIVNNKKLMSLIWGSKLIVLEADTTEAMPNPNRPKFDYHVETPLDEILGFADYEFVKREFNSITNHDLDKNKYNMPLHIMDMIEHERKKANPEKESTPLMESALYAISRIKHIPMKGLETREDMFNIMYKEMPLKTQAQLLLYDLKNIQPFNSDDNSMQPCFEKQDLTCLCKIDDMEHYTRPGDSTIVIKRNLFWIDIHQQRHHKILHFGVQRIEPRKVIFDYQTLVNAD